MNLRAFSLFLIIAVNPVHAADPQAAVDVVLTLHRALLEVARGGGSCSQRFRQLQPVIDRTLDTQRSARLILGRHWKSLEEPQRERFTKLLHEQAVLTYAERFASKAIKGIETGQVTAVNEQLAHIDARLLVEDKDPVALEYEMVLGDGRWRVLNVVADGFSELAMRSAQYRAVLIREGNTELMSKLEQKLETQRAACAEQS